MLYNETDGVDIDLIKVMLGIESSSEEKPKESEVHARQQEPMPVMLDGYQAPILSRSARPIRNGRKPFVIFDPVEGPVVFGKRI
jgi:hypothetical protein